MFIFDTAKRYLHDDAFWENVAAGLAVMFVDLVLVVIGVGALLSYLQKRQWSKTRQSLTYVLLTAMTRVMRHFDACLVNRDGQILLNAAVETHFARLELALTTFNEQMIVHLLALLPPLSEDLSDLTGRISGLQEQVLEARLHFSSLKGSIGSYDVAKPGNGMVDPKQFYQDENARTHLDPKVVPGPSNYFVLCLLQIFERTRDINQRIARFSDRYSGNWVGLPAKGRRAREKLGYIAQWDEKGKGTELCIRRSGVSLVLYVLTAAELQTSLAGETRADDTPRPGSGGEVSPARSIANESNVRKPRTAPGWTSTPGSGQD